MPTALTEENSCERLRYLARTKGPEQKTDEWLAARKNIITCSDIAKVVGMSPFENEEKLFLKKLGYTKFEGNAATRWGCLHEAEAIEFYESISNKKIADVDFGLRIHSKYKFIGGSPDGITFDMKLIEIKCPYRRKYKKGYVPEYYKCQMWTLMEIFNINETIYVEYWPPTFSRNAITNVVTVKRNSLWFLSILPKLKKFVEELTFKREELVRKGIVPEPQVTGDKNDPKNYPESNKEEIFKDFAMVGEEEIFSKTRKFKKIRVF